jgi:adenylate cyclase
VAICFADLVGFTRLGEEVAPEELGHLAVRLEGLAADVVEQPVRLVKTIGDAAMLSSPEPEPLLEAALSLLDAADAQGGNFPQLRAGVAIGPARSRAGDWFGRPVNLASRITAVARPGSLLAERGARRRIWYLPLVIRRRAPPARHSRRCTAVSRPAALRTDAPAVVPVAIRL